MYRQNQLLKELNRLREENERLRNECTFWRSRVDTEREINRSLQLEMQVRNYSDALACRVTPQPIEIKISSEQNEAFQKFLDEKNIKLKKDKEAKI